MNFKYGKFVVLGLLIIIAGVGCSKAGSGSNRALITQDEIEKNKAAAAKQHPGGEPERK